LIGEFLKQAELYIGEGLHPRVVTEGFEVAKNKALEVLETLKVNITPETKRSILVEVAKTSLNTKVHPKVCSKLNLLLKLHSQIITKRTLRQHFLDTHSLT